MLTHDELMESWKKDSIVDQSNIREVMYSHPLIHSKYLTHLQTYKVQLRKLSLKYQKLKSVKIKYYNGELTKEELDFYGYKQYLFKRPLKSELESLIDGDGDIQEIQEKTLYVESLVQTTEMIMKDIGNRYFLFRSLVDYEKFLSGV